MKKLLLILIIPCFLGCGTDQGPAKMYNYSIVNNSSYSIEIIPYNIQGIKEIQRKIIIPIGGVFNKIHKNSPPYFGFNFESLITLNAIYASKVEFIFNNSKKIIYEKCPNGLCSNSRNIFDFSNNIGQVQVYTITNEDYENAIDCGGNCN